MSSKTTFPGLCGTDHSSWLFWNSDLTWNTATPDFTLCFQYTVLQWIPMIFLWIGSVIIIPLLWQQDNFNYRKRGRFNIFKSILTLFLFFVHVINFCLTISESISGVYTVSALYLQPILSALTALLLVYLNRLYYKKHFHTSGFLFNFWLIQASISTCLLYSRFQKTQNQLNSLKFRQTTATIEFIIVIIMFISNCFADTSIFYNEERKDSRIKYDIGEYKPLLTFEHKTSQVDSQIHCNQKVCPVVMASYLNLITFQWLTGLVILGFKRSLTSADLYKLQYKYSSFFLGPELVKNWIREIFRNINNPKQKLSHYRHKKSGYQNLVGHEVEIKDSKLIRESSDINHYKLPITYDHIDPSFFRAYMNTFGWEYLSSGLQKLIYDAMMFVQPQLLSLLIGFLEKPKDHLWHGVLIVLVLYASSVVKTFIFQNYCFRVNEIGMKGRSAVISIVYRKAMRLSSSTRKDTTVGQIVNLMSVDAQKINDITLYFHWSWSSPITIIVSVYFLWQEIGPSVLIGLCVLLVFIPLNIFFGSRVKKLQDVQMKTKDHRIKLMNEILNGIKILKLYAWENSFERMIRNIRNNECTRLRSIAFLTSISAGTMLCTPFLVALFSFAAYVLISPENILTANKAFVSLSLFGILNIPMLILPGTVINTIQGFVAMKRISNFLKESEIDPDIIETSPPNEPPIKIIDGDFSWEHSGPPLLKKINLEVREGSIIAVVGTVGSGKTSLTNALVGEMKKLSGRIMTRGSMAYVPQQAWCQNASLQDNITFAKPLQVNKYNKVLEACALLDDLKVLPAGDQTEIGEKGINLSGGQKQRISLARAVYQDAEIYILDDPLSAVDSHVGKHIFNQVIGENGLLSNKTRLLVTHNLTFLPKVDQIIVMTDGEISEAGSYRELINNNGAFSEYIRTYLDQEEEERGEEEDSEDEARELKAELRRSISRVSSKKDSESEQEKSGSIKKRNTLSHSYKKHHHRTSSVRLSKSRTMIAEEEEKEKLMDKKKKLIEDETAEMGSVRFVVVLTYLRMVTLICVFFVLVNYFLYIASSVGANLFLSKWSEDNSGSNQTVVSIQSRNQFLAVYGGLGVAQSVFILIQYLVLAYGTFLASRSIHTSLLKHILRAPSSFFDTTPTGRILNRIGKDIDTVDINIPQTLRTCLSCLSAVIITILVITIASPYFLIAFVPLSFCFFFIQRFYICTSRQLKRIDSIKRSPIYSHFSESIIGATSIRAYKVQDKFIEKCDRLTDENQMAWFPNIASNRWLQFNLETIGNFIILATGLIAVLTREYIGVGLAGLSITYAIQMTSNLTFMIRTACDFENFAVAIERIQEYTEIEEEAEWEIELMKPPDNWPQQGRVEFRNFSVRYRPGLDLVLKNLNLKVQPGEKMGIVGRTGAGKSSLTLSLFRIIEPAEGTIIIDGIDVTKIGLHDLRDKLTIIPQDPVLFSGTLRMNLDPFEKYTDGELWNSLDLAHLKSFVSKTTEGLDYAISEGGENLSVGQRQLVCLARALLKKTKILVLDEATAAVDLETDELIQNSIRRQFKDCTVLTIAHRLNTIMDYDKVLVLEYGKIKELDSPENLLANETSVFYSMARDAGLV